MKFVVFAAFAAFSLFPFFMVAKPLPEDYRTYNTDLLELVIIMETVKRIIMRHNMQVGTMVAENQSVGIVFKHINHASQQLDRQSRAVFDLRPTPRVAQIEEINAVQVMSLGNNIVDETQRFLDTIIGMKPNFCKEKRLDDAKRAIRRIHLSLYNLLNMISSKLPWNAPDVMRNVAQRIDWIMIEAHERFSEPGIRHCFGSWDEVVEWADVRRPKASSSPAEGSPNTPSGGTEKTLL